MEMEAVNVSIEEPSRPTTEPLLKRKAACFSTEVAGIADAAVVASRKSTRTQSTTFAGIEATDSVPE